MAARSHVRHLKTYGSTDTSYPITSVGTTDDIRRTHHWWQELTTHRYHERVHVYQVSLRKLWARCEETYTTVMGSGIIDPDVSSELLSQLCRWITEIHMNLQKWAQQDIITALASSAAINKAIQRLYHAQPEVSTRIDTTPLVPRIQEVIPCVERVLTTEHLRSRLAQVEKNVALSLIDLFDEIVPHIGPRSRLRSRLFHALRHLCSQHLSLPRSYIVDGSIIKQGDLIGSGGFADVYYGEYKGQKIAVKVFRGSIKLPDQARKMFCREACIWRRLSHPNVLQLIGVCESRSMLCLVSRWMKGGHIISFLEEFPDEDRTKLIRDAISGLEYLHSNDILHGDLKGANILVDENKNVCLSDFGLATVIYASDTLQSRLTTSRTGGSVNWTAPELFDPELMGLQHAVLTRESDVYSLAMTIYEIFAGKAPFSGLRDSQIMRLVVDKGDRPSRPLEAISHGLSDALWKLIETCWQQDPKQRPTVSHVLHELHAGVQSASESPLSASSSIYDPKSKGTLVLALEQPSQFDDDISPTKLT